MIDPKLLWRAWPSGCLSTRGVTSVAGFLAWGQGYWNNPVGFEEDDNPEFFGTVEPSKILASGRLLPNVDCRDPATWACLLVDLAEALNARLMKEKPRVHSRIGTRNGLSLVNMLGTHYWTLSGAGSSWTWQAQTESPEIAWEHGRGYPPYHEDPALMLVWLRILEREAEGEKK